MDGELIAQLVSGLARVIEPSGMDAWFHLPIPEFGGRTPIEQIAVGGLASVADLAHSYLDPAYV